ncbi:MAG TPA: hypothetical protein P5080_00300 [Candidatus Paceibacterota bacterium]|nr:hypothetical protein [Candidatus Paceibacterota bacterium]HSA36136.1 hypothetical protein [Candidatus Paceibacterota bacterium]
MFAKRRFFKIASEIFFLAAFLFALAMPGGKAFAQQAGYLWYGDTTGVAGCPAGQTKVNFYTRQWNNETAANPSQFSVTISRNNVVVQSNTVYNSSSMAFCVSSNFAYAYVITIVGGSNYWDFYVHFGDRTPLLSGTTVTHHVHLAATAQGPNYQAVEPVSGWINYDPQFKINLISYPSIHNITGLLNIILMDNFNSVVTQWLQNYPSGTGLKTIGPKGLSDGWRMWSYYLFLNGSSVENGKPVSSRGVDTAYGIDRVKPVASASKSPAAPDSDDQITITAPVRDVLSGMDTAQIFVDGTSVKTCNFAGETTQQTCSVVVGPYAAGSSHSYYAVARDRAGNIQTLATANFTISGGSCSCTAWVNGSCAAGGCTAAQRQQTRTCTPAACDAESQCVADAACGGSCSCTAWVNGSCAAGGCTAAQRLRTRTCNPVGCDINNLCVADAACSSCSCTAWSNIACGGPCPITQMTQTRNCMPWGCAADWQCANHAACGTPPPSLSLLMTMNPWQGDAPLASTLNATVGGTASGNINYYVWWNCNSTCTSLAACQTACGVQDITSLNQASATYAANHTYTVAGTYYAKTVVERQGLFNGGRVTVTVNAPVCSCGAWADDDCGLGTCGASQMRQTRTCTPAACLAESQCAASASCPRTLTASLAAAPDIGNAPLATTITGTVGGTAVGTINYTTWWDCDDPCVTVSGCQAACGAWDDKADGVGVSTRILDHTYSSSGTFHPKMIVERQGLVASDIADVIALNAPPSADTLVKQNDFCAIGLSTIFSWNYSDPENDPQTFRQIQVDDDSDFSSPADDTGKIATSSTSYVTLASSLAYNTTYHWRLKVWDDKGNDSGWINGSDFTTPLHSYPAVDFDFVPGRIKVWEAITYDDQTQVFGGATIVARSWEIEGANPSTSVAESPVVLYNVKGDYTTKLTVTDSNGYTCSLEEEVTVKSSIPDWEEI